jgi:hypothetical protein
MSFPWQEILGVLKQVTSIFANTITELVECHQIAHPLQVLVLQFWHGENTTDVAALWIKPG